MMFEGKLIVARTFGVSVACGLVLLVATPALSQDVNRTEWGHPDIQGIWDFRTITPLERPEELGDQEFISAEEAANAEQEVISRNEELANRAARRTSSTESVDRGEDGAPGFYNNFWLDRGTRSTRQTSLVIDPPNGRIPAMTDRAQRIASRRREYRSDNPANTWLDRSAYDRCILGFNAGPPITPGGYNQNVQIFQTADHVVLVTEMVHTHRVVPLDGRAYLGHEIRQWSGDSRGYWDGDTLVVETRNFRQERGWRGTSENMTLVERFTRTDAETLEYRFTVTDLETWTRPWTASIPMQLNDQAVFEYACHEGNYSMPGILGGARMDEVRAGEQ